MQARARKAEYEALMVKQERDAWLHLVRMEQQQEEKRLLAQREAQRLAKEKRDRESQLREAAFDGDMEALVKLLNTQGVDVDCRDANGDTPLLEAAGGGQVCKPCNTQPSRLHSCAVIG